MAMSTALLPTDALAKLRMECFKLRGRGELMDNFNPHTAGQRIEEYGELKESEKRELGREESESRVKVTAARNESSKQNH
jgi:hypothetical protein